MLAGGFCKIALPSILSYMPMLGALRYLRGLCTRGHGAYQAMTTRVPRAAFSDSMLTVSVRLAHPRSMHAGVRSAESELPLRYRSPLAIGRTDSDELIDAVAGVIWAQT